MCFPGKFWIIKCNNNLELSGHTQVLHTSIQVLQIDIKNTIWSETKIQENQMEMASI